MGPLNFLRSSLRVLNVVYRLSGLLNLFSRRFDRTENSAARARCALPPGPLSGQALQPLAELPFGAYKMAYNGCEVIAVYNALLTLGQPAQLGAVADAFEKRGILLNGLGGTNVGAAPGFLRRAGVKTTVLRARKSGQYDAAFAGVKTAVLSFWTGKRLRRPDGSWNSLHTVALAHAPDGILVYNASNERAFPLWMPSVSAYLEENGYLPVMLCTAQQGDAAPDISEKKAET